MKRTFLTVVTFAVCLSTAACSALGRASFANPVVELKDVRITGIGLQGGNVDVILVVYNPNDFRLDASKVTYTLFVDTAQIAMGAVTKAVTFENLKKTEIILPISFTAREMFGAAAALTRTGSVDYRVIGEVTMATPFGSFTRPYEGKGRFDPLRPPH